VINISERHVGCVLIWCDLRNYDWAELFLRDGTAGAGRLNLVALRAGLLLID